MGELQAEAYAIEFDWQGVSIVRPGNTYGPFDEFRTHSAMVIPSLIRRALSGENPMIVWGDGSAKRDFVHARDVARGMLMAVENGITTPLNLAFDMAVMGDGMELFLDMKRVVAQRYTQTLIDKIWRGDVPGALYPLPPHFSFLTVAMWVLIRRRCKLQARDVQVAPTADC